MAAAERPDAIFGYSDLLAIAAMRSTSSAPGSVCDMLRRQRVDVLDVAPLKSPVAFVGIMSAISVPAMLMMVALVTGAVEDPSRFGPTLIDIALDLRFESTNAGQ